MRDQPIKVSKSQVQVLQWQKLALLAVILFVIMLLGRIGRSNDTVQENSHAESPIEKMANSAGY